MRKELEGREDGRTGKASVCKCDKDVRTGRMEGEGVPPLMIFGSIEIFTIIYRLELLRFFQKITFVLDNSKSMRFTLKKKGIE